MKIISITTDRDGVLCGVSDSGELFFLKEGRVGTPSDGKIFGGQWIKIPTIQ